MIFMEVISRTLASVVSWTVIFVAMILEVCSNGYCFQGWGTQDFRTLVFRTIIIVAMLYVSGLQRSYP